MKAIGFTRNLPVTDPECLIDLEIPQPVPKGRDLLVRIEAVSVNPIDTKLRLRKKVTAEGTPIILGYDAAGVVEAIGSEVIHFQVGDSVYYAGSFTRSGSNAQFQLVDERIVAHKPKSLEWTEAASIPLTVLTSWEGLFEQLGIDRGGKNAGQSLLLIGGAGGVGSMVIQLAKMAGLQVIATASRPESAQWCKNLGAEFTINYHHPIDHELKQIGRYPVDFIFNASNTSAYWEVMTDIIAPLGSICGLVDAEHPVDLNLLKQKGARFAWEFMFARPSLGFQMEEHGRILEQVSKLLDTHVLHPVVQNTLSPICARTLREAHAQIESSKTQGKIVLTGWS